MLVSRLCVGASTGASSGIGGWLDLIDLPSGSTSGKNSSRGLAKDRGDDVDRGGEGESSEVCSKARRLVGRNVGNGDKPVSACVGLVGMSSSSGAISSAESSPSRSVGNNASARGLIGTDSKDSSSSSSSW